VALQVRGAQALRQSPIEEGYEVALRTGDVDDPIPGLLEIRDRYGNRVDLLLGLRGMDPELLNRTRQVRLAWRMRVPSSTWIASCWTWNCCVGWRSASVAPRRKSLQTS